MTETAKTPGQVAYEAGLAAIGEPPCLRGYAGDAVSRWTYRTREQRQTWEAGAAAVRAPLLERIAVLEQAVSLCSGSCGNLLRECAGELTDLQSQRIAELEAKVDDLETENGRLARQLLPFLGIK